MAADIDLLRKLLALALNNPNEEEARSAAMAAVKMIEEKHMTIGGEAVTMPTRKWSAPDSAVEDLLRRRRQQATPQQPQYQSAQAGSNEMKAHITDSDIDDDFMRKRITLAWQQIRDERKKLELDIEYHKMHNRCSIQKPDWGKR